MSEPGMRLRQLQHIPLFALRQAMDQLLADEKTEAILQRRFGHIFSRRLHHMRQAIARMSREQLTALVDACPEISDAQIAQLFEQYRYGSNPMFQVYLFDKTLLRRDALQDLHGRLEAELAAFNYARHDGLPALRRLAVSALVALPERPGVVEGIYRFQTRLDYIDADEHATCTYQTLYGLLWLSPAEGYLTLQVRNTEVLKVLKGALERAMGISLAPLVISKQLKNALPFLLRESFRFGRLHDPDPGPGRFRWLTVADDNAYARGYQDLEERYPEVHSVRYREMLGADRETTLTIRCDRGALSLSGTLSAAQLRAWTLDRLGQLIGLLNEFRPNAPAYTTAPSDLDQLPPLNPFSILQRHHVRRIISALLTVKQSPLLGYHPLDVDPLQLAHDMGTWMRLQIPVEHLAMSEASEGYLACPICGGTTTFALQRRNGGWELECREHRQQRWAAPLPLIGETETQEPFTLDADELATTLELLPSEALLQIIAEVINRHLPGHTFDLKRESFIIRGPHLRYYPDKSQVYDSAESGARTVIYVSQHIAHLEGGEVVGVKPEGGAVEVHTGGASAWPAD
jgi:hypothetical protein